MKFPVLNLVLAVKQPNQWGDNYLIDIGISPLICSVIVVLKIAVGNLNYFAGMEENIFSVLAISSNTGYYFRELTHI